MKAGVPVLRRIVRVGTSWVFEIVEISYTDACLAVCLVWEVGTSRAPLQQAQPLAVWRFSLRLTKGRARHDGLPVSEAAFNLETWLMGS